MDWLRNVVVGCGLVVLGFLFAWTNGNAVVQTPDYEQTAASRAELARSSRHMEYVHYEDQTGKPLTGFLVYPEVNQAADSVVVVFTGWAMTPWIQVIADRLARDGFVALVPDLLSGYGPDGGASDSFPSNVAHREGYPGDYRVDADDIRQAMGDLDEEEVQRRLRASIRYVRDLPATTDDVSVIGFCWGGNRAFELATREPTLKTAFIFYGSPPGVDAMPNISCPVYGFYGENDFRVNATIEDTKKAMTAAGKAYEPIIYEGVGHGFIQAGTGDRVILDSAGDAAARQRTEEAWSRLVRLLRQ